MSAESSASRSNGAFSNTSFPDSTCVCSLWRIRVDSSNCLDYMSTHQYAILCIIEIAPRTNDVQNFTRTYDMYIESLEDYLGNIKSRVEEWNKWCGTAMDLSYTPFMLWGEILSQKHIQQPNNACHRCPKLMAVMKTHKTTIISPLQNMSDTITSCNTQKQIGDDNRNLAVIFQSIWKHPSNTGFSSGIVSRKIAKPHYA
jgi:hypothetical protein